MLIIKPKLEIYGNSPRVL